MKNPQEMPEEAFFGLVFRWLSGGRCEPAQSSDWFFNS
jgi:hypothetical protein